MLKPIEELPTPENNNENTEVALIKTTDEKNVMEIIRPTDLTRLNELKEEISSLAKQFGKKQLKVKDLNDKEGLKKLTSGLKVWRDKRKEIEEERLQKVGPYNATVTFYNGNYNNFIDIIKEIEAVHKAKKTKLEEEKKAADKAKESFRIDKLITAKAVFDGKKWSVGSEKYNVAFLSLDAAEIMTMSDTTFENILAQMVKKDLLIADEIEKEDKRIADAKIEAEKQVELERQKLEQEKMKMEQDKKDMQIQMAQMAAQMEAMRLEKEALLTAQQNLLIDDEPEYNITVAVIPEIKIVEQIVIVPEQVVPVVPEPEKKVAFTPLTKPTRYFTPTENTIVKDAADELQRLEKIDAANFNMYKNEVLEVTWISMKTAKYKSLMDTTQLKIADIFAPK